MVNIFEKIDALPDGPKKDAGKLMVKCMAEYFLACREANELTRTLRDQERLCAPTKDTEGALGEAQARGYVLDGLVPELFQLFEDLT
jgi:hypothetical protein